MLPAPSGPDGQRMLCISLNPVASDDGDPSTSACCKGMGTREDENGVAPAENGTLGLLVPFKAEVPKEVVKDPAKNKLVWEEFVEMELTLACAPVMPEKGGCTHMPVGTFQTATEEAGDVKFPPTHNLLFFASQNIAPTSPLGPLEPREAKEPEDGLYEATFDAGTPLIEVNEPEK